MGALCPGVVSYPDFAHPVLLTSMLPLKVKDCQIPVDVVLRSSDDLLIGAHKTNLSHHSDGFPDVNAVSDSSEPVALTENAETLELLMEFVHKRPYSNVSLLDGDVLLDLAMAAEKYMVHSAMVACSLCLQFTAKKYPVRALGYAMQHGYPEIADTAGPFTVFESLETMRKGLKWDSALFAWLQYKVVYMSSLNRILARPGPWTESAVYYHCPSWQAFRAAALVNLTGFLNEPDGRELSSIFGVQFNACTPRCGGCIPDTLPLSPARAKEKWVRDATTLIDTIPPLSAYMGRS